MNGRTGVSPASPPLVTDGGRPLDQAIWSAVVDELREGCLVVDAEGRVVADNDAAKRLLAVDRTVGRRVEGLLPDGFELPAPVAESGLGTDPEPATSEADADVPALSRLPTPPAGVGWTVDGTGTQCVVERRGNRRALSVRVVALDDRVPADRLVTLADVSDRRAVADRYRSLVDRSSALLSVLTPDGTITYQTPVVEDLLGYAADRLVGEAFLDLVHEEDRKRVQTAFTKPLRDPAASARVEYRLRTADGDYVVLESLASNPADVDGLVVNSQDVTQRKYRERRLEQQNERLDEFASIVSHDLRNPVDVAGGNLELAREADDPEPYYQEIEGALGRMEAIIDDVLTLARQGETVVDTEAVDFETVARDAWENVDTPAATLTVTSSREIDADYDRLLSILENLYRNATDHVGPEVSLRTGATDAGFFVEDDGPGIPPEDRDLVFDTGFTTAAEGTGFGLAIVQRLAAAHDWSVAVSDGREGGARFDVLDHDHDDLAYDGPTDSRAETDPDPTTDAGEDDPGTTPEEGADVGEVDWDQI
jgi:PAS domain S-box-containing protein